MWNEDHYKKVKDLLEYDLSSGNKTTNDLKAEYNKMMDKEEYEVCKAIYEILEQNK